MKLEPLRPRTAAGPAVTGESGWETLETLDGIGSYVFAAFILVGGMGIPLGLAVYSLFFRG